MTPKNGTHPDILAADRGRDATTPPFVSALPHAGKLITALPPEVLSEMRLISRRLDAMAIALGRADLKVAEAEGERMVARNQLGNETAQLKAFVSDQAKKLSVPTPWNFDLEIGGFVSG
jgi:hypothetical protein